MKLSILIPTLNEERNINKLRRLRNILDPQVSRHSDVEIKINDAGRGIPTGFKRNALIHDTDSEYFSMIDDDDLVPAYYVDELLKAMESNPDVITFNGYMTTNGINRRNFVIKLGEKYEERNGVYYRYPNHLCCFKRSVVQHVRFEPLWVQEDYKWATDIMQRRLLKSETHLELDMYCYDFETKNEAKIRRADRIRQQGKR